MRNIYLYFQIKRNVKIIDDRNLSVNITSAIGISSYKTTRVRVLSLNKPPYGNSIQTILNTKENTSILGESLHYDGIQVITYFRFWIGIILVVFLSFVTKGIQLCSQ